MTPGARISAAIDCLDQIFSGSPAEKALTGWARRSRFAGSKDRAAVRDHVFDALRCRDSFAELGGSMTGRGVMIGLSRAQNLPLDVLFSGEGHSPEPLSVHELENSVSIWHWDMPDWCVEKLKTDCPESASKIADALKRRAPVDLRVNKRKISVSEALEMLENEGILAVELNLSEYALRITENPRKLKSSSCYLDGFVELQDAGSQALVDTLPVSGCEKILDFCAGGGGKSLAIAGVSDVKLFAHDVNTQRMKDIPARAKRAGANIVCVDGAILNKHAPFDLVLCDAPCSGSGSWRRSPDAKWRLTRDSFTELLELQRDILRQAAKLVSPSGFLSYATCSLFSEENEDQVNKFLEENPKFRLFSKYSWSPLDECDGFFVTTLQLRG